MSTDVRQRQFEESAGYADSIVASDTVYLSGVVATLRDGETTFEPAFDRAFQGIANRLAAAGCTWDDVVEMTTFHTDLAAQWSAFSTVKRRYVRAPFPAWTAIGVSRLVPPNGLVEIRVTAHVPDTRRRR